MIMMDFRLLRPAFILSKFFHVLRTICFEKLRIKRKYTFRKTTFLLFLIIEISNFILVTESELLQLLVHLLKLKTI
jgi:hypothetical protein